MKPICMSEEYWANSPFSIARHYGQVVIDRQTFVIVNKEGKDIFELSAIAERQGRSKAIEPGEPADLVRKDFITYYRALKRDKFLEVLMEHPHESPEELKKIYKALVKEQKGKAAEAKKKAATEQEKKEPKLFD